MTSKFVLPAAIALSSVACSDPTIIEAPARNTEATPWCTYISETDTAISWDANDSCVGCSVMNANHAADGDTGTSASMTLPAATDGTLSLRIGQDATLYPAGRSAGVWIQTSRLASTASNTAFSIRTYLDGQLQDEQTFESVAGLNSTVSRTDDLQLLSVDTTRPYNAVELAIESDAQAGDFTVDVVETCADTRVPDTTESQHNTLDKRTATAVIADFSAGTNPYHEVFRRPWYEHPSTIIPGFPEDVPALPLTLGDDWAMNAAADANVWASMQERQLYWVPGTNLLLYKNAVGDGLTGPSDRPIYSDSHGTGTSGTMAITCPDCYVLVMQDPTSANGETVRLVADEMPWVDIGASTQVSDFTVQEAVDFSLANPNSAYAQATRRLAETGRTFFAAAGNTPVTGFVNLVPLLPIQNWDLPPWVVTIGGAHGECHATEAFAGDPQDFVGDFVQTLPVVNTVSDMAQTSGTSFATPQVAALAARTILYLRQVLGDDHVPGYLWSGPAQPSPYLEDGHLSADELIRVLSLTARYFAPDEYDANCALQHGSIAYPTPASPTPWIDMGWGYVGQDGARAAADVLLGLSDAPAKDPLAVEFMMAFHAGRIAVYGEPPQGPH